MTREEHVGSGRTWRRKVRSEGQLPQQQGWALSLLLSVAQCPIWAHTPQPSDTFPSLFRTSNQLLKSKIPTLDLLCVVPCSYILQATILSSLDKRHRHLMQGFQTNGPRVCCEFHLLSPQGARPGLGRQEPPDQYFTATGNLIC